MLCYYGYYDRVSSVGVTTLVGTCQMSLLFWDMGLLIRIFCLLIPALERLCRNYMY